MDSWNRFNETKLPDKKEFYNNLNQEAITNKDHKNAKKVWDTFNIRRIP